MTCTLNRRTVVGSLMAWAASGTLAQPLGGSIIVPSGAGSFSDSVVRRHASLLGESTRGNWLVENIPGASGIIAARQLLARPADGRTLLWATSGMICNAPLLAKPPLEFNPVTDFVPVSIFVNTPFILFTGAASAAGNLAQLQQLGKSRSEPLTYMPIDLGSANHLAAEMILQRLGLRGLPVAYRNVAQAVLDIGEGRVDLGVISIASAMPAVRAGKLKALALLTDRPSAAAQGVPTVQAQGFGPFDLKGWSGFFLAKGTPHSVVMEHEGHVRAALATPSFSEFLLEVGQEVQLRDHAQSRAFIEAEVTRSRGLLQALKLI